MLQQSYPQQSYPQVPERLLSVHAGLQELYMQQRLSVKQTL